jgi:outer membrane protein TolC
VNLDHHGLDERLASHPEIEVLSRQQEVLAAEARLAGANRTPDWTVEVAYQKRGSAYGDMFTVGVKVPLPWDAANRQDRELSARLAEARKAEAQRDEMLRQHVADVRAMLQEWESNRGRVARYEREIVPLAQARAEATLAAFRGGKSSVSEVLAARRGELEARLQALQLENETARLWAQLTFLAVEESK